jgi:hypothetical protein
VKFPASRMAKATIEPTFAGSAKLDSVWDLFLFPPDAEAGLFMKYSEDHMRRMRNFLDFSMESIKRMLAAATRNNPHPSKEIMRLQDLFLLFQFIEGSREMHCEFGIQFGDAPPPGYENHFSRPWMEYYGVTRSGDGFHFLDDIPEPDASEQSSSHDKPETSSNQYTSRPIDVHGSNLSQGSGHCPKCGGMLHETLTVDKATGKHVVVCRNCRSIFLG